MRPSRKRLVRAVAVVALSALVVAACSEDDGAAGPTTTTGGAQGSGPAAVEFLSGEVPESLPDDFPIPAQGVIGGAMINHDTGVTELILRIPASVPVATRFYEDNFAARSYDITSSDANGAEGWIVGFAKDGLTGIVELSPIGTDLSKAVVRAES